MLRALSLLLHFDTMEMKLVSHYNQVLPLTTGPGNPLSPGKPRNP